MECSIVVYGIVLDVCVVARHRGRKTAAPSPQSRPPLLFHFLPLPSFPGVASLVRTRSQSVNTRQLLLHSSLSPSPIPISEVGVLGREASRESGGWVKKGGRKEEGGPNHERGCRERGRGGGDGLKQLNLRVGGGERGQGKKGGGKRRKRGMGETGGQTMHHQFQQYQSALSEPYSGCCFGFVFFSSYL